MVDIEFGTIFRCKDGTHRVVVDVGDDRPEANLESLGIVSFEPLLITYVSGSEDPTYIDRVLDILLSVDEVIKGIANNSSDGIQSKYEELLREYASRGKIRTITI